METLAWSYMQWFYSQLDVVYVNSEHYRQRWIERGIASGKTEEFFRAESTPRCLLPLSEILDFGRNTVRNRESSDCFMSDVFRKRRISTLRWRLFGNSLEKDFPFGC